MTETPPTVQQPARRDNPHHQYVLAPATSYKTLETWAIRVTALILVVLPIWMLSPPSVAKQDLILTSILVGCFMSLTLFVRPNEVQILAAATGFAAVLVALVQLRQSGG
ncbi:hypothetical protein G647_05341 [Cladophialophora carrionii CBS 160.54]|uniref:DUF6594 domain-containing protein n=1 Tax=Cladophialophora carrionii CBS 160.54 TaxID=1279043 RepID=V9D9E0_9EURO|nr:uncharacterized protein G647_05341 [Cladophialophora carrionii CBS 160.54]ETI23539.1 hypothetical protein G647_05341 [Cladophialophora carrionii CBS 160.54]